MLHQYVYDKYHYTSVRTTERHITYTAKKSHITYIFHARVSD